MRNEMLPTNYLSPFQITSGLSAFRFSADNVNLPWAVPSLQIRSQYNYVGNGEK